MSRGSLIVTGASTGIGEATALHLTTLGFDVFAGVRRDEDAERLSGQGLRALKLDVTDQASIAAARAEVGEGPLAGLVNNAGIAVSAPIEFVPLDELRKQLEVNLIGQVAVTQAFLPALRRGRGRIVNISSIGGRIALPMVGPYAASKFALEAQLPPEAEQLYGKLANAIRGESERIATETGLPPQAVADAVGEVMTAKRPKTRQLIGREAKLRVAIAKRVPDRVMDALIARTLSS